MLRSLVEIVFPGICPGCGIRAEPVCEACAATVRAARPEPVLAGLDACHAAFAYEGVVRELVARAKYRNARSALPWLAARMAALVTGPFDVVTWAPTTPGRRRGRGFDHAELLARDVARHTGGRLLACLARVAGPPQTGAPRPLRLSRPAFRPRRSLDGLRLLLVDDVVTTGGTLAAAGITLRAAGAVAVTGLVAARRL